MIGVDTTFLVQLEIVESENHTAAWNFLRKKILANKRILGLSAQVLSEFIHIVTDSRRFEKPLSMTEALEKAEYWWQAKEVQQIYPDYKTLQLFFEWMEIFSLGRKRILDTYLAATYYSQGITDIVSSDARDFKVFGCFTMMDPAAFPPG